MGSHLSKGRGVAGFVIAGILLAVAGCQSSDGGNVLNVGDKSEPAATQFVFVDPSVVIPVPEPNTVQIFVGYDEGPYDTK